MTDLVSRLRADGDDEAADEIERLREAVTKAKEVFTEYAALHFAKNTPEASEKAATNANLALEMYAALAPKETADG